MVIREAKTEDTPEILSVLKASLGESSSKKTEDVWNYKHLDNPFGKSLILLAIENDEIAGVRAFMRWNWQYKKKVFSAFRAVDTATHPNYQGKGIFKKLTLQVLEKAQIAGDHFVFNTPNSHSKPGYLKMGWKEISNLNLHIKFINPIYWRFPVIKSLNSERNVDEINSELINNYNDYLEKKNKLFTPKSVEYLKWRYLSNPLQNYVVISKNNLFLAGYVKKHNKFNEFRVSEVIFNPSLNSKIIIKEIAQLAKSSGAQFLSYNLPKRILRSHFHGKFGPTLTFKSINLSLNERKLISNLNEWEYSLGDMELF